MNGAVQMIVHFLKLKEEITPKIATKKLTGNATYVFQEATSHRCQKITFNLAFSQREEQKSGHDRLELSFHFMIY